MNIQELATIALHRLPIKILLFNNHGYSMIRQTQDQWFDSQHFASSAEGGVADPGYERIAQAYGIETLNIRLNADAGAVLEKLLKLEGPVLCQLELDRAHRVIPQVKFGRPNEDAEPLLDRDTFLAEMIIPPHPFSIGERSEGADSFATRNQTAS
jgi:acetolactate synthase-1/2/3 large subunit